MDMSHSVCFRHNCYAQTTPEQSLPQHTAARSSRRSRAGSGTATPTPHSLCSRNLALAPCSSGCVASGHPAVLAGAACSTPPALTELARTDLLVFRVPGQCCQHPESYQRPPETVPGHPHSMNATVIPSHALTAQTAVTTLSSSLPQLITRLPKINNKVTY